MCRVLFPPFLVVSVNLGGEGKVLRVCERCIRSRFCACDAESGGWNGVNGSGVLVLR